ncbi:hypothetical protein K8R47_03380 [archaeon]|nr:hypothetical protein [archaeon]
MSLEDNTEDTGGLGKLVVGAVFVGLGIFVLGETAKAVTATKARRRKTTTESDNICVCGSCNIKYQLENGVNSSYCSNKCEIRGDLLDCLECRNPFYRNEGFSESYCSRRCDDDAHPY